MSAIRGAETAFVDNLDDLFDVAHAEAITLMNIEDNKFLEAHREKGRRGCMGAVGTKLARQQERCQQPNALDEKRLLIEKQRQYKASVLGILSSSSESEDYIACMY